MKQKQRTEALARRDAVSPEERTCRSRELCAKLTEVAEAGTNASKATAASASNASDAGYHVSVPKHPRLAALYNAMRSEVDLAPLTDALIARGWEVCFPVMVRETPDVSPAEMRFFRVPAGRLTEARVNVLAHPLHAFDPAELERAGYHEAAPAEIDFVAVPLVAFDDANRRLGYGGGNYDRFLPQLRPDALVVGVAFEEQRVPAVICEPHDLPLPHIVTA